MGDRQRTLAKECRQFSNDTTKVGIRLPVGDLQLYEGVVMIAFYDEAGIDSAIARSTKYSTDARGIGTLVTARSGVQGRSGSGSACT